mmetsp:Transcript_8388/g.23573  ORF Transcript_8388/g.23573 Transcript_8388/m.23573 type:complete len:296 (-) Transcript_8388:161-1048(-)
MGDGPSKAMELAREDETFLTESPRSDSSGGSRSPGKGESNGTLIIYDWDDTLLCSAAASTGNFTPEQLQQLSQTVVSVLRLSMSLGETMIVTNGNATWVQDSSQRFLPGVVSTLADMEVMSARALYENLYPGDPFAWKREAFYRLMERRLSQGPSAKTTNLVVLGDSGAEMEAAHQATKVLGDTVMVKTVKLREAPTVQQLIGQLNRIHQELRGLVNASRPISKRLELRRLPSNLSHMTSWASTWRLAVGRDWSKPYSFADSLFPEDDEPNESPTWMIMLGDKLASVTKGMTLKH